MRIHFVLALLPTLSFAALRTAQAQTSVTPGNLVGSQTWTAAGSPYIVPGDLTVPSGVTLTLQAGTTVHLGPGDTLASGTDSARTELRVAGTLISNGTPASRVTIRSGAATQATSHFYGVVLLAGSTATLSDTTVEYGHRCLDIQSAGATITGVIADRCNYGVEVNGGSPTLTGGELRNNTGYGLYAHTSANVTATNLRIYSNSSYGVYANDANLALTGSLVRNNGSRGLYLRSASGTRTMSVQRSTIYANSSYGIEMYEAGGSLLTTVRNNVIVGNGTYGLRVTGAPSVTESNNLVWSQSTNYSGLSVGTGSIIENPLLVDAANGDYRLTSRSGGRFAASDGGDLGAFAYDGVATPQLAGHLYIATTLTAAGSPHTVTGDLTVEPGVTLTVEPGATVRFASQTDVMNGGEDLTRTELRVRGTLVADGTASTGIIFTSAAATPARGDWYGIRLLPESVSSIIDYATIQYGRYGVHSGAPAGTVIQRSMLEQSSSYGAYFDAGAATLSQATVRNSSSYGIYSNDASPTIERSIITDNGSRGMYIRSASGTRNVSLLRNTIVGNSSYGVEMYEAGGNLIVTVRDSVISVNGTYGLRITGAPSVTESNNLVWGQSTDYSGLSVGTGSIIENPLFVDLANRDLRITSRSPGRNHASDATDIGALPYDGAPTVGWQGHLYANTTWTPAGGPIDVLGDITVEPGVTLTVQAGTTVRFAATDSMRSNSDLNRSELIVLGRLVSDGTAQSRITFTSAAATPARGQWYGVHLTATAANSAIDNTVIEWAQYGLRSAAPSSASILQSEVRQSSSYGLYVDAGALLVDGVFAHSNASYGIYVNDASPTLHNMIVASNGSRGMYLRSASGTRNIDVNHATVISNSSYGIESYEAGGNLIVAIRNSIIASNGTYGIRITGAPSMTLRNNNVWGQTTDYSGVTAGPSSISANPQFVNTGLQNYYLLPSSTSIDAADPATALDHDFSGTTRPLDGDGNTTAVPDLGAFEYNPSNNRWPIADAGPPRVVTSGIAALFDGTGSFDPDGTIASYAWNFGDGTTGNGAMVMHTFTGGTDRMVTLTVTDNAGAIDVDVVSVEVNLPPVANAGPTRFADPAEIVTFSGAGSTDSDGTIVSYAWDFGDGSQASGISVTHQYAAGGTYTVTLTITDDDGATAVATTTANITGNDGAPPTITHTPVVTAQPASTPVAITANVTDSSGVASVTLFYRTTGAATYSSVAMTLSAGSTYQAQIPGAAVVAPGVQYYLRAVDQAPAANAGTNPPGAPGAVHAFTVAAQPPVITHTPVANGQPAGQAVTVAASVTSPIGIGSVTLHHRAPGGGAFTVIPMNSTGGNGYSAQIPAIAVVAPQIEYYIQATDTAAPANSITAPGTGVYAFTITQTDTSPPTITHVAVPNGQLEGVAVNVSANITDGSGVATATLRYRLRGSGAYASLAMTAGGGGNYSATIPMSAVNQPGVDYYIEATDIAAPANTARYPAGAPGTVLMFTVVRSFNISQGDLVVSEVMADPSGDETLREWFELYNTTAAPIDIDGFTFRDDGSDSFTVNNGGPLLVPAGGYLVLGRNANSAMNGGVTVGYVYTGFALSNRDDEIVIMAGATQVDHVGYDDGVTFPQVPGRSITLDPTTLDYASNDDGSSWCSATSVLSGGDYGTPGAANDPCQAIPDTTPPTIVHTIIADGQQAGVVVAVSAIVTDASGLGAVSLFYRSRAGGAYTEATMLAVGGNVYQGEIPAGAITINGVEYYLRAVDASPNANETLEPAAGAAGPHDFDVSTEDQTGPAITHVPIRDGRPAGVAITVMATITDASGVADANLHFRSGGGAFVDVGMTHLGGGAYTAEVPANAVLPGSIEYYLSAIDASPAANRSALPTNGATAPYRFTVTTVDLSPPVITHTPIADDQPAGGAVAVVATVTDDSGVAEVRVYFRQSGTATFLSAPLMASGQSEYIGEIPAAFVAVGGVDYYLEAADASDDQNTARDPAGAPVETHSFTVISGEVDSSPPAILHLPIADGRPQGTAVTVLCEIVDPSGIDSASLFYRVEGESTFVEVTLGREGTTDRWSASIPGAAVRTPGVEYYIAATDAAAARNRGVRPEAAPGVLFSFTVSRDGLTPPDDRGEGCACSDTERRSGGFGLWLVFVGVGLALRRRR